MPSLRTAVFYFLLGLSATFWCLFTLPIAPFLPLRFRYVLIARTWCRFAVWLTSAVLNIRYEVEGLENIPKTPCVVLPNTKARGKPST